MSDSSPPVVLVSHAAWHQPLHYRRLIDRLRAQGLLALVPQHRTCGYDDSIITKSISDDSRQLKEELLPQLDLGRNVVVVTHSYGGIPATEVVLGHSVGERSLQGLKGGVAAVVHISSILPLQTGVSSLEANGGDNHQSPFHDVDELRLPLKHEAVRNIMYGDVDGKLADEAMSYIADMASKPYREVIRHSAAEIKAKQVYVICTNDKALPIEAQRMMAQAVGASQVDIDAGHIPFLNDAALDSIIEIIKNAFTS